MKKIFHLFGLLMIANLTFVSCRNDDNNPPDLHLVTDAGVVINNVRWATRNVDAPGTFAPNPEDGGMFFQWNRQRGWVAIGDITNWDNSVPTGTAWYAVNDPCPAGWRVPNLEELLSLRNAGSIWIEDWNNTNVNGHLFGTAPYQVFLPAVGWLDTDGVLNHTGIWGGCWSSSTQDDRERAQPLWFGIDTRMHSSHRAYGLSVRCVTKN